MIDNKGIFNKIMSVTAFLALIALVILKVEVHRAVYSILGWLIFQFSKDEVVKILELWKKW